MLNRLLLLVVVGGLLPQAAGLWWGFEVLSHFRLQYLALALPLLVVAVAARQKVLGLLLAASVAINAWPVLPYLPAAAAAAPGETLVILNVNVRAKNPDHARVLERIRAADADIVVVIELSPALDAALAALGESYPHRLTAPAHDNFGLGVLSRQPLVGARVFDLGPTAAIESFVELPAGRLRLLAVHPMAPMSAKLAATRNDQLERLAALARHDDAPLVVCGDFNLSPYSPFFRRFETDSGTRAARRGRGIGISWPASMPLLGVPIDHCFARAPLVPVSVERMDRTGSDHYPVRVMFRWPNAQ